MESTNNVVSDKTLEKDDSKNKYNLIRGSSILGAAGISAIIAGIFTSHFTKKKNQEYLKELGKEVPPSLLLESPYSLAFRALAWGTVWAVAGFSLITFGIWKLCGFKNMDDFKTRMRSKIKKSPPTDQRTEFENLADLINYLSQTSESKKGP